MPAVNKPKFFQLKKGDLVAYDEARGIASFSKCVALGIITDADSTFGAYVIILKRRSINDAEQRPVGRCLGVDPEALRFVGKGDEVLEKIINKNGANFSPGNDYDVSGVL